MRAYFAAVYRTRCCVDWPVVAAPQMSTRILNVCKLNLAHYLVLLSVEAE